MSDKHQMRAVAGGQNEPLVAVIVVNWNSWRDALRAYESLRASSYANWLMVLVDNASSDDSLERLAGLDERVRLIANSVNSGFAGGCNLGFAQARRAHADYVFLLNCDAWVEPDALAKLVGASRRQRDAAVLGAVVKSADDGHLQFFGSRRSAFWGRPVWLRDPEERAELRRTLIDSDFVFGAALFAPISLLDAVGTFDERFFLNFEETDWCYRARGLGYACKIVTSAVVGHKGGASLGPGDGPLQTYFLRRNQLLFAEKHGSFRQWERTVRGTLWYLLSRINRDLRDRSQRREGLGEPTKSLLLAVRDYSLRRFGDCPPVVRQWAALYAQRRSERAQAA